MPDSIQSIDSAAAGREAAAAPARRRASNFLVTAPRRSATRQLARRHGPAARLLLPGDRAADRSARPRHQRAGRRRCPASPMYILIGRTPDYAWSLTSAGHDVRDVYRRAASASPTARQPTRASTHYLFNGQCRAVRDLQRGPLNGQPIRYHGLGARPGVRHRHRRRQAVCALAQALDLRARRAQPRRAQGHDRGQGDNAAALLEHRQPVRLHLQLGLRLAQGHRVLLLRMPAEAPAGPRPPAADARDGSVRVDRAS